MNYTAYNRILFFPITKIQIKCKNKQHATLTILRFYIFMSTKIFSINSQILYTKNIHINVQHIKFQNFSISLTIFKIQKSKG